MGQDTSGRSVSPLHPPSPGTRSWGLPGPEGSPPRGRGLPHGWGPLPRVPMSSQRLRPAAPRLPKWRWRKEGPPGPGTRQGSQVAGGGGVLAAWALPPPIAGYDPDPRAPRWLPGSDFQLPCKTARAARPGAGARGHGRRLPSHRSGDLLPPPAPRSGHPSPRRLPACLCTGPRSLPCSSATTAPRTGWPPWP